MSLKTFMQCIKNGDVLGAILVAKELDLNRSYMYLSYPAGCTPFVYAIHKKSIDIVIALIEMGADINQKDSKYWTPLHWTKNLEMAKAVIDAGADLNAKTKTSERTPLHMASEHNYLDLADLLIKSGADIESRDIDGDTPLHLASLAGHTDMVRLLLKFGADINSKASNSWKTSARDLPLR